MRYNDWISLGAAASFGATRGDSRASSIDAKEFLITAYGVAHWGAGYVSGMATAGSSSFDIDRSIEFGPTTRIEQGNTSAAHFGFELTGGFAFGNDDFRHGPYASLTVQRVKVDGYSEDSLDSTAMWFSEFSRRSTIGRLGYQAQGHFGDLHPYGRVAFAKDRDPDQTVAVQAGSNTMNGHFTFDGYIPAERWYEADLGVEYSVNDDTELSFAWRGRLNDEGQDVNSVSFGARWEF